ncbi:HSP18 transcriptional regulator [Actinokineospora sp. 24-640]
MPDEHETARDDLSEHYGAVDPMELLHEVAGGPPDSAHVISALILLRHLRSELGDLEPRLIAAARDLGVSWARLAPALGVTSRQAAERRYLRLRPDAEHDSGERRVRAERDRRAGARAVNDWAQRNSAALRGLAGQVAAVDGLTGKARRSVADVHNALGEDDPAALLAPLAEAAPFLRASHPALATRITTITDQTRQVRQDTSDQRAQG